MKTTENTTVTINTTVNAPIEKVWQLWITPSHIIKWNNASDDWHTTKAENDFRVGGKFNSRMEAKDGSTGFDFEGVYDTIETHKRIDYTMSDGRKVTITFNANGHDTSITETFETEQANPVEMQRDGWQAILDNFKKYAEKPSPLQKIGFNITIKAPAEKVYRLMLKDDTYRKWTSVFNPSSHYVGSWEKGSKILFIGSDEKGNKGGMVSRIAENIPNKFVSIQHIGVLNGDEEITSGPAVEGWAGSTENYTFEDNNGATRLSVEMDTNEEYKSYFSETWPKALEELKEMCEQ